MLLLLNFVILYLLLINVFFKLRYVRRLVIFFLFKLVSVLFNGCLFVSVLSIVVVKFGLFFSVVVSLFSVFSVVGVDFIIVVIVDFIKVVVVICVLLIDCVVVGVVGVLVNVGFNSGVFSVSVLLMVVLNFGLLLMVVVIFFIVFSVVGVLLIRVISVV